MASVWLVHAWRETHPAGVALHYVPRVRRFCAYSMCNWYKLPVLGRLPRGGQWNLIVSCSQPSRENVVRPRFLSNVTPVCRCAQFASRIRTLHWLMAADAQLQYLEVVACF